MLVVTVTTAQEYQEDMVDICCGDKNCYEVLGVNRNRSKKEISKAYMKLARKWLPDMFRTEEVKDIGEKKSCKLPQLMRLKMTQDRSESSTV